MRVEDLTRGTTARAQMDCPELADEIQELASLQHSRGCMSEQRLFEPLIVEIGAEVRKQTEQIRNLTEKA